jgi:hypothetical protein
VLTLTGRQDDFNSRLTETSRAEVGMQHRRIVGRNLIPAAVKARKFKMSVTTSRGVPLPPVGPHEPHGRSIQRTNVSGTDDFTHRAVKGTVRTIYDSLTLRASVTLLRRRERRAANNHAEHDSHHWKDDCA